MSGGPPWLKIPVEAYQAQVELYVGEEWPEWLVLLDLQHQAWTRKRVRGIKPNAERWGWTTWEVRKLYHSQLWNDVFKPDSAQLSHKARTKAARKPRKVRTDSAQDEQAKADNDENSAQEPHEGRTNDAQEPHGDRTDSATGALGLDQRPETETQTEIYQTYGKGELGDAARRVLVWWNTEISPAHGCPAAEWKAKSREGRILTARLKVHGIDDVLHVVRWFHLGADQRAIYLRDGKVDLAVLISAKLFGDYRKRARASCPTVKVSDLAVQDGFSEEEFRAWDSWEVGRYLQKKTIKPGSALVCDLADPKIRLTELLEERGYGERSSLQAIASWNSAEIEDLVGDTHPGVLVVNDIAATLESWQ